MNILVTGGGGFLGTKICQKLKARGDRVLAFQRGYYEELEASGVEQIQGDLTSYQALLDAMNGMDAVIHVAAKAGIWGAESDYMRINYEGTRHVVDAAKALGVTKLVYTSTPSVVHGGQSLTGIDESAPYPELDEFLSPYPRSKSLAERHVLKAHGPALATVALRPHLIWGPGDNHLIPRLIDRAQKGRLFLVGDGENIVDSVFVDNAADAHLLALDRLSPSASCGGKAYFITQGEPMPMKALINAMLGAAGLPPCEKHISVGLAKFAGAALESFHRIFAPSVEPRMTRFLASQLATDHFYSIEAAKRDLGYSPALTFAEGIAQLKTHLETSEPNG